MLQAVTENSKNRGIGMRWQEVNRERLVSELRQSLEHGTEVVLILRFKGSRKIYTHRCMITLLDPKYMAVAYILPAWDGGTCKAVGMPWASDRTNVPAVLGAFRLA